MPVRHIIDGPNDGVVQPPVLDGFQSAFFIGGPQVRKHIRCRRFLHRIVERRLDRAGEPAFGHDNGFRIFDMSLVKRDFLDLLGVFVVEHDSRNFFGIRNPSSVTQQIDEQAFVSHADDVVIHGLYECREGCEQDKGDGLPFHAVGHLFPVFIGRGVGEDIKFFGNDSDGHNKGDEDKK